MLHGKNEASQICLLQMYVVTFPGQGRHQLYLSYPFTRALAVTVTYMLNILRLVFSNTVRSVNTWHGVTISLGVWRSTGVASTVASCCVGVELLQP